MERAELAQALARWRPPGPDRRAHDRRLIIEASPARFMARFAQAVAGTGEVFVGSPAWGEDETAQVRALLATRRNESPARGWLMIPTGGTSGGEIKFARHDAGTIGAAVRGFARHFGLRRANAVGVLPHYHVSGLMAWLRSAVTGGDYLAADWRSVAAGQRPDLPERDDGWLLSLVPTQLERLMAETDAVAWLRRFRVIFIGGGPSWQGLRERAQGLGLPVAPSYGMTETAAMVAALRPGDQPADASTYGSELPHARISFDLQGAISVTGESVFRGYFPAWDDDRTFATSDYGERDFLGRVRVLGRRDGVIITGGEKVQPLEVEEVLRDTREFRDLAVLGLPHPQWGQQVVAAYAADRLPDLTKVKDRLARRLAAHKHPKHFVAVRPWPLTAHGKLNRAKLATLVAEQLRQPRQ